MVGKVGSLNASVAGSIVLAAARQARLDAAARAFASRNSTPARRELSRRVSPGCCAKGSTRARAESAGPARFRPDDQPRQKIATPPPGGDSSSRGRTAGYSRDRQECVSIECQPNRSKSRDTTLDPRQEVSVCPDLLHSPAGTFHLVRGARDGLVNRNTANRARRPVASWAWAARGAALRPLSTRYSTRPSRPAAAL